MTRDLTIALLREQKCHVSGEHYEALENAILCVQHEQEIENMLYDSVISDEDKIDYIKLTIRRRT